MIDWLVGLGAAIFAALSAAPSTPPCEYEDGSELQEAGQVCVWLGEEMGNEVGVSFVVVRTDDGYVYFYEDGWIDTLPDEE